MMVLYDSYATPKRNTLVQCLSPKNGCKSRDFVQYMLCSTSQNISTLKFSSLIWWPLKLIAPMHFLSCILFWIVFLAYVFRKTLALFQYFATSFKVPCGMVKYLYASLWLIQQELPLGLLWHSIPIFPSTTIVLILRSLI